MTETLTSGSPRILIVKLSAIGDVIHAMPVAQALRAQHPQAWIGWVVERAGGRLLESMNGLDWCKLLPKGFLKSPSLLLELRRELHAQRVEVAIDLQGLTKSAVVAWLSGAPRRIGFGGAEGREFAPWFYTERVLAPAPHVIEKNLALLGPLGITDPPVGYGLRFSLEAEAKANALIKDMGLSPGYVVQNPGAGWVSKRWPPGRFAAVAAGIREATGLPSLVVWAGAEEEGWARRIVAESCGAAYLAPPTTLSELGAVLQKARLCVGSDTGPLHLAVAVGTPCVGLYGPMPRERNGPYGPGHIALQKVWVHGTSRERRNAPADVMEAITVEEVLEASLTLLAKASGKDGAC